MTKIQKTPHTDPPPDAQPQITAKAPEEASQGKGLLGDLVDVVKRRAPQAAQPPAGVYDVRSPYRTPVQALDGQIAKYQASKSPNRLEEFKQHLTQELNINLLGSYRYATVELQNLFREVEHRKASAQDPGELELLEAASAAIDNALRQRLMGPTDHAGFPF